MHYGTGLLRNLGGDRIRAGVCADTDNRFGNCTLYIDFQINDRPDPILTSHIRFWC